MIRLKYSILFLVIFMSLSCSSSDSTSTLDGPDVEEPGNNDAQNLEAEEFFDISYGENSQEKYDIYLPANRTTEDTKVLLLIHGGAWTSGDKSDMSYFLPILRPQLSDYAIVNMNYVLANQNTPAFPNQIDDVGDVIQHVIENAGDYSINPEFGIVGLSAGAHLGLQYTYAEDNANAVKMACSVVGPVDFTDSYYSENPDFQYVNDLVDDIAYPPNEDLETLLSPALQVTENSVPTILFYGESDPLVPQSQANAINDALEANNIEHSLTIYEGGHANWSLASYTDLQAKLVAFIQEQL